MYMYMYTYMYMGKNYTLYLKVDQFASEPNKGGLVNKLLQEYYGSPKPQTAEIKTEVPPNFKKQDKLNLCKIHNLPLTIYGKCLMKGCKYG